MSLELGMKVLIFFYLATTISKFILYTSTRMAGRVSKGTNICVQKRGLQERQTVQFVQTF